MSQTIPHLVLIYGYYSITAEKTITGGILAKVLDYNMVYSQGLPNDKKVG